MREIVTLFYRYGRYLARLLKLVVTLPFRQKSIEVDEAVTIFGGSYGPKGWHHIVETLREFERDPQIYVTSTTLYRFLTNFRPRELSDFVDTRCGDCELLLFEYPWGPFNLGLENAKDPLNSRFCGPSTDEFIEEEFKRTLNLYRHVREKGYQPWARQHSFIGGTFLQTADGRRRFVVLQGNHRLAILSHLGVSKLPVRTMPGVLPVVREWECHKWPRVVDGTCSEECARMVFNWFFTANGFHLADRIEVAENGKCSSAMSETGNAGG